MAAKREEDSSTSVGTCVRPSPRVEYVNFKQEDQMEICGYRRDSSYTMVTWMGIVLTLGILRLLFYWKPAWMLKCTHTVCPLRHAEKVLLTDRYAQQFVEKVEIITPEGRSVKMVSPSTRFRTDPNAIGKDNSKDQLIMEHWDDSLRKFLVNKKLKYLWSEKHGTFVKLSGLEGNAAGFFTVVGPAPGNLCPGSNLTNGEPCVSCHFFHTTKPPTEEITSRLRVFFETNSIPVHVTPVLNLVLGQVLNPFYIFQVFSICVWFSDHYYYYAGCIIVISVVSISFTVYTTRQMQRALKNTVESSSLASVEQESGEYFTVNSEVLVPGDIIEIPRNGCVMSCDAVLISGNCIVNESMLTGESVPVTKTPLPNPKDKDVPFEIKQHSRHILFCGTHVIQTRFYGNQKVKAVVIRTGFMTAKGELVRSIMFPKPVDFKFYLDTYKFLGSLAGCAVCGMIYTLFMLVQQGKTTDLIVRRVLDLVTIAVPPALPAALAVGIVMAQSRLKKKLIYCIQPSSINIAGSVNTVCFDKTGTLTEDGLDMWGVVPVNADKSGRSLYCFGEVFRDIRALPNSEILYSLAVCHSLTRIDGKLSGDPLDVKMFDATGWELEETGEDTSRYDIIMPTIVRPTPAAAPRAAAEAAVAATAATAAAAANGQPPPYTAVMSIRAAEEHVAASAGPSHGLELGIVRQFTFSSSLQRMSVIVRNLHATHFDIYVKGSPEMVASLSRPETVPSNFYELLAEYTTSGYRVIALAHRPLLMKYLKVQRVERADVEKDLEFLGLLVMENRLKPETTPVIGELAQANIRTVMVTGDNMLTALSVARECGLVPHRMRVILVSAVPPVGTAPPLLEFHYAENSRKLVTEVQALEVPTEVAIDMSRTFQFAITGKSWAVVRRYFPSVLEKLVVRGAVYARMSPDQKAQLVEALQNLGYYVGMCGDGANDCGALKAAHAGISLSEADASVASPFTSRQQNISCVPRLIKEGRSALVTSFGIFKFIASYSMTQFMAVLVLYYIGCNLTDGEFLYQDLALIMVLSITFGRTPAHPKLHHVPPLVNLGSVQPVVSLLVVVAFVAGFQAIAFLWTIHQPWFEKYEVDGENYQSYENTVAFTMMMFQTIAEAIMFSKGAPYRRVIFRNYIFLGCLIVLTLLSLFISIYPPQFVIDLLYLKPAKVIEFRLLIVALALGNGLLFVLLDLLVLETMWFRRSVDSCQASCAAMLQRWRDSSGGKRDYLSIERELLLGTGSWPPVEHPAAGGIASVLQREASYVDISAIIEGDDDVAGTVPSTSSAGEAGGSKPERGQTEALLSHAAAARGSLPLLLHKESSVTGLIESGGASSYSNGGAKFLLPSDDCVAGSPGSYAELGQSTSDTSLLTKL